MHSFILRPNYYIMSEPQPQFHSCISILWLLTLPYPRNVRNYRIVLIRETSIIAKQQETASSNVKHVLIHVVSVPEKGIALI